MTERTPPLNPAAADDDAIVEDLLLRFNNLLDVRSQMFVRVAIRVTTILRVGMISAGVVAVFVFLLTLLLTLQFENMANIMNTMNSRFGEMSQDMTTMRHVILEMDKSVSSMPVIVRQVKIMDDSVAGMSQDMETIAGKMDSINSNIDAVSANVNRMSGTFSHMDHAVYGISSDVNVMSGPMKDYNNARSFMPWP